MSNLGFQSAYHIFNGIDGVLCERSFLPGAEDLHEYTRSSSRLFSLETQSPIAGFDIIAFSVSFEQDYINIPRILRLGAIPVYSCERGLSSPLVIAGGAAVLINPEPIAEFMDVFAIGEGEVLIPEFMEAFKGFESRGVPKESLLKEMSCMEGMYVPSLYDVKYGTTGLADFIPRPGAPQRVKKVIAAGLDDYVIPQSSVVTPDTEFRGTFLMEVERGCGRGCRFCAAGFIYLPPRERSPESLKECVGKALRATGRVGLVGAAVSEYRSIRDVLRFINEREGRVTLSSLRLDVIDEEMISSLKEGGYETITLAPEAGSERLRDVINKGLGTDDVIEAVRLIRDAGFHKVRLYFMVGLPTETEEDIEAIADLVADVKGVLNKGELTLSVNPFVPKPWTPFQWHPYGRIDLLKRKFVNLRRAVEKMKGVRVKTYSARDGYMQAYLSRGDRRVAGIIADALERGWTTALKSGSPDPESEVYRERGKYDVFPWDVIDHGIDKGYLWDEYQRGLEGKKTPPCNIGFCKRCGVCH